jgi:phage head maturation protease
MLPIQREIPVVEAEATAKGVTIRALPLDQVTRVSDDGKRWYQEVWRAGAFDGPMVQPGKTWLQRNHGEANGSNIVGVCRAISEDDGHVVTEFEFLDEAPMAALARRLLMEGTWQHASVSVIMAKDGVKQSGDVVERTRVGQFRHLAIVDTPAYETAGVVSVRHDLTAIVDDLQRRRARLQVKRPRHGPPR